MAQYPKTTGQAVTTKIKTATQDDDGRMKLDAQLIEMMGKRLISIVDDSPTRS